MKLEGQAYENHLLQLVAAGDRNAFRQLYDAHHNRLYFFVLRLTGEKQAAEDTVQEVFIRIWTDREKLGAVHNLDAWLFVLARNKVINAFRRSSLEQAILKTMASAGMDESDCTTQQLDFNDTKRSIRSAIDRLPPRQKMIFQLYREQGLRNEEIANQLNISPLTVKKQVLLATRTLRHLLEKTVGATITLLLLLLKIFS